MVVDVFVRACVRDWCTLEFNPLLNDKHILTEEALQTVLPLYIEKCLKRQFQAQTKNSSP